MTQGGVVGPLAVVFLPLFDVLLDTPLGALHARFAFLGGQYRWWPVHSVCWNGQIHRGLPFRAFSCLSTILFCPGRFVDPV